MDKEVIIISSLIFVFFIVLFATVGSGIQQQHDCDTACAPARSITPVVGGKNICLCDEGQGKWRRVEPNSSQAP